MSNALIIIAMILIIGALFGFFLFVEVASEALRQITENKRKKKRVRIIRNHKPSIPPGAFRLDGTQVEPKRSLYQSYLDGEWYNSMSFPDFKARYEVKQKGSSSHG